MNHELAKRMRAQDLIKKGEWLDSRLKAFRLAVESLSVTRGNWLDNSHSTGEEDEMQCEMADAIGLLQEMAMEVSMVDHQEPSRDGRVVLTNRFACECHKTEVLMPAFVPNLSGGDEEVTA